MIKKEGQRLGRLIALLILVVVLSCTLVGSVLAWLERDYTRTSELDTNPDTYNVHLGEVGLAMYDAEGNPVASDSPYKLPTTGTVREVNLKVRNTGNIDALLRANIRVYMKDNNNNITLLLGDEDPSVLTPEGLNKPYTPIIKIKMSTTGWVQDFPDNNSVAAGYMFYNSKLLPYNVNGENVSANEVTIISNIAVPAGYENAEIYVSVTLDAVAWAGNIYRKISQLCPANITETSRAGDSRLYLTFTPPADNQFVTEIPVKARISDTASYPTKIQNQKTVDPSEITYFRLRSLSTLPRSRSSKSRWLLLYEKTAICECF